MKCVVFGGGGFIGSAIVDRLLQDGHQIRIFGRTHNSPYGHYKPSDRVEWAVGDFSSIHDFTEVVSDTDIIIHSISTTLPKSSNDDPVYDVQSNLVSTLQLLNNMVTCNVRKIIFVSSGGTVYGKPQYHPIDENHSTNPLVSYGITKLAIEKYLLMYKHHYGISPIVLRVANPYGARQSIEKAQGAVGVFLHKALHGKPVEIWGDGSTVRDYIYISDVAEAIARAVEYKGNETIFNISTGQGTSLNELVELIEDLLDVPVMRSYHPGRPFDVPLSVLSSDLAQKELDWAPRSSMRQGLINTINGLKELKSVVKL